MELHGISFSHGVAMQERIRQRFAASVTHYALDKYSFFLVVAFGRCKLRLSSESVGSLLQAALGGSALHFFVEPLADRVFRFVVSSKQVGCFIASLRFFSCDAFKVFFHLWGNGGPNWRHELKLFIQEEEDSWSSPRPPRCSFTDMVRSAPLQLPKGIPSWSKKQSSPVLASAPWSGHRRAGSSALAASLNVLYGANAVPIGNARSSLPAVHLGLRPGHLPMRSSSLAAPQAVRSGATVSLPSPSVGPAILSGANTIPLATFHS